MGGPPDQNCVTSTGIGDVSIWVKGVKTHTANENPTTNQPTNKPTTLKPEQRASFFGITKYLVISNLNKLESSVFWGLNWKSQSHSLLCIYIYSLSKNKKKYTLLNINMICPKIN